MKRPGERTMPEIKFDKGLLSVSHGEHPPSWWDVLVDEGKVEPRTLRLVPIKLGFTCSANDDFPTLRFDTTTYLWVPASQLDRSRMVFDRQNAEKEFRRGKELGVRIGRAQVRDELNELLYRVSK